MSFDGRTEPAKPWAARDVVAGLFLCTVAAAAYFGIAHLPMQDEQGIGPGLMPKSVAMLIAVLGLAITAMGLASDRMPIMPMSLRGPLFVLGAVVIFAGTIRPLGLAVAGPVAVMFAALADRDSRPLEVVVFAVVLSVLCIGLFKYVLRLPIPLAPFVLGY